ncbi:uncharacterized protein LOC115222656 [Octopus sinensis]|uniref:Uncharacterized protein LOC115222656 n=1 Tax=Octopus sinensis TaxID=2607531 RepID=A0A6P7TEX1_9MOLL|nr:uncharacterized protein LOC115222656 [Octopus sinensis]
MEQNLQEKPKVINLSKKTLYVTKINILAKGLKFTPTLRRSNHNEINDNILQKTIPAEALTDYDNEDESLVKNSSNYLPHKGRNKTLDDFCNHIQNFPYTSIKQKINPNLNNLEWKNRTELQNHKDLTIKEADKGSAVVLMDTEHYKKLVPSILENEAFYEKVINYKQQKTMKNLASLILLHGKGPREKETDYITNFKCKPSLFYGLPKIHKSKIINEACKQSPGKCINIQTPEDLTLRPIVAGPACETHRLSNFLDILLKLLLKYFKSFIRDDLDMLEHLPKTINEEAVLVTLDNNYFLFGDTYYRQKCGIAMGTKAAPVVANLIMAYFEFTLYEISLQKNCYPFYLYIRENWKRYLDDCFIIWKENNDKILDFKSTLNDINNLVCFLIFPTSPLAHHMASRWHGQGRGNFPLPSRMRD